MGQTWEMRDFLKLMQILHDSSIISGVFSIFRLYPLSLMSGGYENVNKEYSGNFVLFWFFTSIRFIKYYIILLPFFQLIVVLCWWSDTKWPFLFFILFLLRGGGGVGWGSYTLLKMLSVIKITIFDTFWSSQRYICLLNTPYKLIFLLLLMGKATFYD